jgi:hypothetical protein
MVDSNLTRRRRALFATVMLAATLSGCAQTQGWLNSIRDSSWLTGNKSGVDSHPTAEEYLIELSQLSSSDPVLQAEVFAEVKAAAGQTPGPSTTLQYALALATPGHPESDPEAAQSLLRELLTQPALMTPEEILLATVYLKSTEELILLNAETRRLRASVDRAQRTEAEAVNRRLVTVEAENRRLRRELEEAEDKLEAITSIERSIRQQDQ